MTDEQLKKSIGKNIQRLRNEQNITQKQLAEKLDMNIQSVSQMERGVYKPSIDKLIELSKIFNVTPNDIILEDYEYEKWKEERFTELEGNVRGLLDEISVVEELWAKAESARLKNDEKLEKEYIWDIINIYAWRNEHFADIANYLYKRRLEKLVKYITDETRKNKTGRFYKVKEKLKELW